MSQDRAESSSSKPNPVASSTTSAPNIQAVVNKAQNFAGKIRVISGANEGYFDLKGKEVGSVKKTLRDVYSIAGDAKALVNGKEVGDNHILEQGQSLEFIRDAGVKG